MSGILKTKRKLKIMRDNIVYINVMHTMNGGNVNFVQ